MNQTTATLIGAAVVVLVNLLTATFVYGRLTEKVRGLDNKVADHHSRIHNVETVLSGTGGHGERLTALEAWRIEQRGKIG